ncbi:phage tail protein I [Klebsiella quasipneumoniae]|uniref:phage tail protein I n=1 Tax=Klebsiella pneumoniae complex TaxID=3390273 RepID=UPI0002C41B48|nr:phage tail protein I [Klebsiella quasipneumoniae]AMR17284.1 phage tail protein I [Klebsiella quasipneumoniae]AVF90674.1 phage tail protein I [Klebsiella quasipneumoniae]AWO62585.1 phage tail protein I [Klebsiella quasipneumoniae subsp. similipneumoniae]EMR15421.1 putative prophage tail protein [Klebsiella quasipneumoniae]MBK5764237.1 phage tail protein I [Klebsiella quasipneumoniae]
MNNSLLPPGSSALERRLAQACSGISDLNVPLRDLWNPWKCPVSFLPYLAWAFSVDSWDEAWSEAEKRSVISESFWLHQRKGTVAAIRRVTEKMGYSMSLEEWWEIADPAGTFRLEVDVNEAGLTSRMLDELDRLVNDAKPLSRHLAQLNISSRAAGVVATGSSFGSGEIINIYPEDVEPDDEHLYNGMIFHDGNFDYR